MIVSKMIAESLKLRPKKTSFNRLALMGAASAGVGQQTIRTRNASNAYMIAKDARPNS